MAVKKETAVASLPSAETLARLNASFPREQGFERRQFPRLSLTSQDKTEGKGKAMVVIEEAGTFFTEHQDEIENPKTGKKEWTKNEVGTSFEGVIAYNRKQLRYFDSSTSLYTSSPIYDNDEDVLPLFCSGAEIERGTPAELQALYPGLSLKGKPKSKLEENKVLNVLYKDELYQMTIRGTSMYAYKDYARKTRPSVNAYMTSFSSEPKQQGSTEWNQMTFSTVRALDASEALQMLDIADELRDAITQEKSFFAEKENTLSALNKTFDEHISESDLPRLN